MNEIPSKIVSMCLTMNNLHSQGENSLTRQLVDRLMARKRIYVIVATFGEKLIIRFVICSRFCQQKDIEFAWTEITSQAAEVLSSSTLLPELIDTSIQKSVAKNPGAIAAKIESLKIAGDKLESQKIWLP